MAGRQQRRRQWERRVARWRASGLSMAAYCRQHGLSYWMFVRWRQRIEAHGHAGRAVDADPGGGPDAEWWCDHDPLAGRDRHRSRAGL